MKKIFLVEDDTDLYSLLEYNLRREGFETTGSQTGKGVLDRCRKEHPDLVLLDIMLPDCDGIDVCKAIRNEPELSELPVIFLTARASETDRVIGLEIGASDYVVKPFFIRELMARIRVQLRRRSEGTTRVPSDTLRAAGIEIDRNRCRVLVNGQPAPLTVTEYRLLELFMSRPGMVFTREQLLDSVWGNGRAVTDRAVDVYILRLRQKVEPDPAKPTLIHSVRGFGYKFEPVEFEAQARGAVV
ncbi:MAG: response regulator transcription factor [Bryobacteraceae bacterium]